MLMKKLALCICLMAYPSQVATAGTITFDDGTAGNPIGGFYSLLGVTLSNASWGPTIPQFQIGGSTGLVLEDITDDGFNPPYSPTSATPIVGTFSTPQHFVSILGVDVGIAGIELDAFDAASGGNLLGSAQFFGTGGGFGIFDTLSISAPGIVRFELFQPSPTPTGSNPTDGVVFDNLMFNSDPIDSGPEPETWMLMGAGLLGLIGLNLGFGRIIRVPAKRFGAG
jgi:hypothetical protein